MMIKGIKSIILNNYLMDIIKYNNYNDYINKLFFLLLKNGWCNKEIFSDYKSKKIKIIEKIRIRYRWLINKRCWRK